MMRDNRRRKFDDGNDDRGGGRYFKKRRTSGNQERKEEDPLKCIILDVGEKTKASVESSIEGVAKVLEADLSTQKGKILGILVEMVTFLPEKCTIYSTLAGLLNAKNYNFGGEFVEALVKTFKDFLRSGNWVNAQYTLRFIADLVNCHVVSATSLLQLFDTFMEGAQAGEAGIPQVRRDWFVYAILNTLPWVGRELYDKREQTVERLMIIIDNYMKKRKKIHHELLRIWATDDPHPQEEYLDCLWAQVEKLKMDGWIEKHIARPYLVFDSILCEALQHNLPSITLPPHHENMQYPLPRVIFRMFDYTDCPEGSSAPVLPGAHSIERFLIEQELKDILRKHHLERKECSAALLEYQNSNGSRVPLEYMIVEVIFGELFKLPTPDYLEVCYGSILIELCKRQPAIIPQVLAQTTELLYTRIDTMNVSCIDRFASWFAYHLTNFQLRWSWDDWASVLQMEPEHPKPKFIQEVIYKCTRLSYLDRISEVIPKTFESLLPEQAEPCYKYDADIVGDILGITQAKQLQAAFREKAALDEILVICKAIPNPMEMDEGHTTTSNPLAINIFAQTIFLLGSKTLSHTLTAISKYQPIFKALVDGDEAQLNVLKAAYDVWKKDKQMLAISVEMLLKCQIIDFSSVANWVFTKEMAGEFTKIYLWEILHMSIRKMSKHVTKMTTELSEAREKLRRAEMNSSESENEDGEGVVKPKEVKDIPNEEMVDKMEEKLEAAQADQKNLFLIVFQRFIMILSEHIAKCDTDGINFNTLWYRWTIGRLQQVFMQHADQVAQYSSTLETLLFTQDLDKNILQVFQQFQALRT